MNEECGLYSILTRRKKKLLEFELSRCKRGEIKGLSCQEVGPKYSPVLVETFLTGQKGHF